jgi:IS30 family transposase
MDSVNNYRTRDNSGDKHPMSKLTSLEVLEIRRLADNGVSRAAIQVRFGVSKTTIANIILRKTWGNI